MSNTTPEFTADDILRKRIESIFVSQLADCFIVHEDNHHRVTTDGNNIPISNFQEIPSTKLLSTVLPRFSKQTTFPSEKAVETVAHLKLSNVTPAFFHRIKEYFSKSFLGEHSPFAFKGSLKHISVSAWQPFSAQLLQPIVTHAKNNDPRTIFCGCGSVISCGESRAANFSRIPEYIESAYTSQDTTVQKRVLPVNRTMESHFSHFDDSSQLDIQVPIRRKLRNIFDNEANIAGVHLFQSPKDTINETASPDSSLIHFHGNLVDYRRENEQTPYQKQHKTDIKKCQLNGPAGKRVKIPSESGQETREVFSYPAGSISTVTKRKCYLADVSSVPKGKTVRRLVFETEAFKPESGAAEGRADQENYRNSFGAAANDAKNVPIGNGSSECMKMERKNDELFHVSSLSPGDTEYVNIQHVSDGSYDVSYLKGVGGCSQECLETIDEPLLQNEGLQVEANDLYSQLGTATKHPGYENEHSSAVDDVQDHEIHRKLSDLQRLLTESPQELECVNREKQSLLIYLNEMVGAASCDLQFASELGIRDGKKDFSNGKKSEWQHQVSSENPSELINAFQSHKGVKVARTLNEKLTEKLELNETKVTSTNELEKSSSELAELLSKLAAVTEELQYWISLAGDYEYQLKELQVKQVTDDDILSSREMDIERLKGALADGETNLCQLQDSLQTVSQDLTVNKCRVVQLEVELEVAGKEKREMEEAAVALKRDVEKFMASYQSMKQEVQAKETESVDLKHALNLARSMLAKVSSSHDQVVLENTELKRENERLKQFTVSSHERMVINLVTSDKKVELMQGELSHMDLTNVESLESKNSLLEKSVNELTSHNSCLVVDNHDLQSMVSTLQCELEHCKEVNIIQLQQVDRLRVEVATAQLGETEWAVKYQSLRDLIPERDLSNGRCEEKISQIGQCITDLPERDGSFISDQVRFEMLGNGPIVDNVQKPSSNIQQHLAITTAALKSKETLINQLTVQVLSLQQQLSEREMDSGISSSLNRSCTAPSSAGSVVDEVNNNPPLKELENLHTGNQLNNVRQFEHEKIADLLERNNWDHLKELEQQVECLKAELLIREDEIAAVERKYVKKLNMRDTNVRLWNEKLNEAIERVNALEGELQRMQKRLKEEQEKSQELVIRCAASESLCHNLEGQDAEMTLSLMQALHTVTNIRKEFENFHFEQLQELPEVAVEMKDGMSDSQNLMTEITEAILSLRSELTKVQEATKNLECQKDGAVERWQLSQVQCQQLEERAAQLSHMLQLKTAQLLDFQKELDEENDKKNEHYASLLEDAINVPSPVAYGDLTKLTFGDVTKLSHGNITKPLCDNVEMSEELLEWGNILLPATEEVGRLESELLNRVTLDGKKESGEVTSQTEALRKTP